MISNCNVGGQDPWTGVFDWQHFHWKIWKIPYIATFEHFPCILLGWGAGGGKKNSVEFCPPTPIKHTLNTNNLRVNCYTRFDWIILVFPLCVYDNSIILVCTENALTNKNYYYKSYEIKKHSFLFFMKKNVSYLVVF